MNRATPTMQDLAKRLISHETFVNKSATPELPVAFHVCGKLQVHLARYVGKAGFRALLARALATAEIPRLRAVQVQADGAWAGLAELSAQMDPVELGEGGAVVLAQLLGLLEAFIGESLTLRLVGEVWPKLALNETAFRDGVENEKAK